MQAHHITAASAPGLVSKDFRCIAKNGFGDPYNAYPHAMTWFGGSLYVGTTRANLHYRGRWRSERHSDWLGQIWPVEIPKKLFDIDLRAQIWRYDPVSGEWRMAYISPLVEGVDGFDVPISIGFRSMTPYKGARDSSPAIYVPTWGSHQTPEAVMLRSADGVSFEQVSEPGLGFPDPYQPRAVRGLIEYKGRLYASPAVGKKRAEPNTSGFMVIFVTDDPAGGAWEHACEPHFGDPNNLTVFHMAVFNGWLYAGTLNVKEGFQIWKTDAEGRPPYKWRKVLGKGAYRGKFNQFALRMHPFNGSLYVGTAIQDGGADPENKVAGPPEIIRVNPDDSWDLVMGEPRITPDGLKLPLSGMGPGFGNPFSGYMWSFCEHEGWLYAGNFEWTVSLRYVKQDLWPGWLRKRLTPEKIESLIRRYGGCDLWRSRDGRRWVPVTLNGMGNYYNYGIRNMVSTEHGLFVGFTNPYGPRTAVKRVAGWKYEENPDGGLEIWLGKRGGRKDDALKAPIRLLADPAAPETAAGQGPTIDGLLDEFYRSSGFRHLGFWSNGAKDPGAACENLMEEVLAFIPERRGPIADAWPPGGASAGYLMKYFKPGDITGFVGDKDLLPACRKAAPGARFTAARQPELDLAEGFDSIIKVTGLEEWGARARFLEGAYRSLRPGGLLVIFDVLRARGRKAFLERVWAGGEEEPCSIDEYRRIAYAAGFREECFADVTGETLVPFREYALRHLERKALAGDAGEGPLAELRQALVDSLEDVTLCVMAALRRPTH